jgi:endonuclease-8
MPEGDTLYQTADVLRKVLEGQEVRAARGRVGGAALARLVGSRVERVESNGKHLLIRFSSGLTLHTHLAMHGSWHRYLPGERWRRTPSRAVAVIEVPRAVAVCFDAPTVELLETRALALHPSLSDLGPDLLAPSFDADHALALLRSPGRAELAIGDALLDQRAVAGIGNVFRSEICFVEQVDPFVPVRQLDDDALHRLLATARGLLSANRRRVSRTTTPDLLGGPPGSGGPRANGGDLWVYGRAGRPCRRCGSAIRSALAGTRPRRVYWCPTCQVARADGTGTGATTVASRRSR